MMALRLPTLENRFPGRDPSLSCVGLHEDLLNLESTQTGVHDNSKHSTSMTDIFQSLTDVLSELSLLLLFISSWVYGTRLKRLVENRLAFGHALPQHDVAFQVMIFRNMCDANACKMSLEVAKVGHELCYSHGAGMVHCISREQESTSREAQLTPICHRGLAGRASRIDLMCER